MEKYQSSQLSGINRCNFRRKHPLSLASASERQDMSNFIKSHIKTAVYHGCPEAIMEKEFRDFFASYDYDTETVRESCCDQRLRQALRYVRSEHRKPLYAPEKTVCPFGIMDVSVHPDFVFKGTKEYEYTVVNSKKKKEKVTVVEPYIEVVLLKPLAQIVTNGGRSQDVGAKFCLELYTMILYGRSLLENGEDAHVEASYYYLKKSSDATEFDSEYFGGSQSHIVRLSETSPEALDALFEPQFRDFIKGEDFECNEEKCKYCEWLATCNYKEPILPVVEPGLKKKSNHITPTEEQKIAIGFRKGIARINAGAGTGKTLVTSLRTKELLQEGVDPSEILLLTFTRSGAAEMKERIDGQGIPILTFNSFCYQVIKEHYELLGFSEAPSLVDEVERAALITELLNAHPVSGLDYRNFLMDLPKAKGAHTVVGKAFEIIKREGLETEDALKSRIGQTSINDEDAYGQLLGLYKMYNNTMKERCLIEYADQEMLVKQLLDEYPDFLGSYRFRHIFVDEFQDTNELQLYILKKLVKNPAFESLLVVGDDSQSIFGFRGSNPDIIIHFFDKMEMQGDDFYILDNFRSTPEIIRLANGMNSLCKNRVDKSLRATRPSGKPVTATVFFTKEEETEYVVGKVKEKLKEGYRCEDIAYIAYTNGELFKIKEACEKEQIPCIMITPEPLAANQGIRAAISLAGFIQNPEDTKSAFIYLSVVYGGLSAYTQEEIQALIIELREDIEQIKSLPEDGQMEEFKALFSFRYDELYESFKEMLYQKKNVGEIIRYCMDFDKYGGSKTKKRDLKYSGVTLTTAHSSKGLEWKVVINSLTKYFKKDIADMDELYRLLFVSFTRARDELFITGQAVAYGKKGEYVGNQFLVDSYGFLGQSFPILNPDMQEH